MNIQFATMMIAIVLATGLVVSVVGLNFLIGGANGVNENISKNVDLTISLSNMTFPHMLARIVLVEQIYRSETIINNHPYHKI